MIGVRGGFYGAMCAQLLPKVPGVVVGGFYGCCCAGGVLRRYVCTHVCGVKILTHMGYLQRESQFK